MDIFVAKFGPVATDSEQFPGDRPGVRAWPIPSRGVVHVSFHVSRPQRIEVDIHDVRGRLVRKLSRHAAQPGTHLFEWDGMDASGSITPAGAYILRIHMGQSTRTEKLILLR